MRASGEPYLVHPLEVAAILAEMRMDPICVAVGLLHDVLEDTLTTPERLARVVRRRGAAPRRGRDQDPQDPVRDQRGAQAENFRKMLLAMVDDIRVILVKLADRLHNMRTLRHLPEEPPGADRARDAGHLRADRPPARHGQDQGRARGPGLPATSSPRRTSALAQQVEERRKQADGLHRARSAQVVDQKLRGGGHRGEIAGRIKRLLLDLAEDASARASTSSRSTTSSRFRDRRRERRRLLRGARRGAHTLAAGAGPDQGLHRDAEPNFYQSLHTSVIGEDGQPFEVQIRTREMHPIAEEGIAAHWKYKEGRTGVDKDDHAFAWLRQLLEWQQEVKDPREFLNSLKVDLYPDEVYTFTPKGEVKALPRGATPIDFAYAIHTEVGHHCVGARVNGKLVPLRYTLRNGDIVEILTSPGHKPEPRLAELRGHEPGAAPRSATTSTPPRSSRRSRSAGSTSSASCGATTCRSRSCWPSPRRSRRWRRRLGVGHAASRTCSPRSATARSRCARCWRGCCRRRSSPEPTADGQAARGRRRGQAAACARARTASR